MTLVCFVHFIVDMFDFTIKMLGEYFDVVTLSSPLPKSQFNA